MGYYEDRERERLVNSNQSAYQILRDSFDDKTRNIELTPEEASKVLDNLGESSRYPRY